MTKGLLGSKPYPDRLCHIDHNAHPYICGCLQGDDEAQRRFDEHQRTAAEACNEPVQPNKAARALNHKEQQAFNDWAFRKDGEAIGRLDGHTAGMEAWHARAAIADANAGRLQTSIEMQKHLIGSLRKELSESYRMDAEQPADSLVPQIQRPITVEAVAVSRVGDEGQIYLEWLLEGGIAALEFDGQVLVVAQEPITNDEGYGEVLRYGAAGSDPESEDPHLYNERTLEELKELSKAIEYVNGINLSGPADKVGALLACATAVPDLVARIEQLEREHG
jgi:hypothetical protein